MSEQNLSPGSNPSLTPEHDLDRNSAGDRLVRLISVEPWLHPAVMEDETAKIISMNASFRVRHNRLEQLADRVNAALAPLTACRQGCHHCCSMVTLIYRFEAVRLAEITGRKMVEVPHRPREQVIQVNCLRPLQQCVFVNDGNCSVYEHRPMICRLHHSLEPDAERCRALLSGHTNPVMQYDPDFVEEPYHALVLAMRPREPWGPITEFFPVGGG